MSASIASMDSLIKSIEGGRQHPLIEGGYIVYIHTDTRSPPYRGKAKEVYETAPKQPLKKVIRQFNYTVLQECTQ